MPRDNPSRIGRVRALFSFVPTPRFAALVALLAPLWLVSASESGTAVAVVASAAIVVAAGIDLVRLPPLDAIVVERQFPATIGVGDRGSGEYELRSRWPRTLTLRLFDRLPAALEPDEVFPVPVAIPAFGTARVERRFTGAARGGHALGPVALRAHGQLGLIDRTLRFPIDDRIRGIPSVAAVRQTRLLSVQQRLRAPGVRAVRPRGEGRNFSNLRDYTVGDDPRHIDWKATARRGKVITREYALEQGQQILIAIDAGRLMTQLEGPRARFEYALSSALVLADIAVHSGDAVGLIVFDDVVRRYITPARGASAVRALRDALTDAEARLVEPDYAAAFRTIASRQRNRALIVLYTDVLDVRSSQTLVAHLTLSAVRHLPLVVALRNEELAAAAHPARTRAPADVYHAAAAEEMLTARDTALAQMRAVGVSVVNAPPTALTAAVVNRYLDIKARGAL